MAVPVDTPRARVAALAAVCAALTVLISVVHTIHFAYWAPELHVALDTTVTMGAIIAAILAVARLRARGDTVDLLFLAAVLVLAGTNILFSTLPSALGDENAAAVTLAAVGGRFLGAVLLAVAAFAWRVQMPRRAVLFTALLALVAIGTLWNLATVFAEDVPLGIDPNLQPSSPLGEVLHNGSLVMWIQLPAVVLYVLATIGFLRRAERTGDRFMLWLALGSTLAAFASVNYFLFPSRYSDWFYTGDVFRLAFILAIVVGVSREILSAQNELARAQERRAIARDLHDGLAQELAFIRVQANRLARDESARPELRQLEAASQRALDEARSAIQALTRDEDEPLHITLTAAAEEIAERGGARLELDLPTSISAPPSTREALRRIVREAVTNAVRHGRAENVWVSLTNGDVFRVAVRDDGEGFDPGAPVSPDGGFGLVSMRERVEALGGTLALDSTPGAGTSIEVVLPCLPND